MPEYPELEQLRGSDQIVTADVVDYLLKCWCRDYYDRWREGALVQVADKTSFYLFDLVPERLVVAWSFSYGKVHDKRDLTRQRGAPKTDDPAYHRGHAIPHQGGGGLDINLVDQLGRVNIGAFRVLENTFVKNPKSLYFTYWFYGCFASQTPCKVEQGVLIQGKKLLRDRHAN